MKSESSGRGRRGIPAQAMQPSVWFFFFYFSSVSSDFHPLLASAPQYPGVKVHLHPRGLAYLNQVSELNGNERSRCPSLASKIASNVLAEQLPRIVIPDVEQKLANGQGVITIKNIRISRFRRAEQHLITTASPNRLSWNMRNLDLGFIGDLSGNVNIVIPFNLTGQAEILAEGLTFSLDNSIEKSGNGSGHVTSLRCMTTIRTVHVTNHNGGLFGLAVDVFKEGVSNNVRNLLQETICKRVRSYIDEDLNVRLSEVQTKSPLADALEVNALRSAKFSTGASVLSLFPHELSKVFFIDFRLKEEPLCGVNEVELASVGEISPEGRGGTPFGPAIAIWPTHTLRQEEIPMLSLLVSDFLPNSLFYNAYKQGYTRLLLTQNTPGVAQFLRTSCDGDFCIADLVPQLSDHFPNSSIELALSATRAPAILFSEKNGGTISTSLVGTAVVYAVTGSRRKQAAVIDVDVVADARLSLTGHTVSGKVQLTKFDLKNRLTGSAVTDGDLADISLLVSQLLENMINEMLNNGFPLPIPHVLKLQNTRINVYARRLLIRTDMTVDERSVSRLASQTIFRGPTFGEPRGPWKDITQIMSKNG